MIVVDSSVWIDFIRGNRNPQCDALSELLVGDHIVCLTGLILTEILRGSRSDNESREVMTSFQYLPFIELRVPEDYVEASRLYRAARSAGVTVNGLADLLIATSCIRHNAWLLHNDRDFDNLASVTELQIWDPG